MMHIVRVMSEREPFWQNMVERFRRLTSGRLRKSYQNCLMKTFKG